MPRSKNDKRRQQEDKERREREKKEKKEGKRRGDRERREEDRRKEAKEARKRGLSRLKAEGTTVFMWREQWEGETIEQMRAWDRPGRSSLLKKGPGFRPTPTEVAEEELEEGATRAILNMVYTIRNGVREGVKDAKKTASEEWEDSVGLKRGTFKRRKGELPKNLDEWQSRLEHELDRDVTLEQKGGGSRGNGDKTYGPQRAVANLRAFSQSWPMVEERVHMNQLGAEEEERRQKERSKRPQNVGKEEWDEMRELKNDEREFLWERADKGGASILVSREKWKEDARRHALDTSAYLPIQDFLGSLREKEGPEEDKRWIPGGVENGDKRREWRSSRDFTTGEEAWEINSEQDMIEMTLERLENYITSTMKGILPESIICDIVGRTRADPEWMRRGEGEVECAQREEQPGGLGEVDVKYRESLKAVALEVVYKLHKTPVKTRPIGRACASPMKQCELLVGSILVQILNELEEEEVERGGEGSILDNGRIFVRDLEKIAKGWDREQWWEREELEDQSIYLYTADVEALYPSLSIEYIIREIDTIFIHLIETKTGEEKEETSRLREMCLPLLIFMLEHQFLYVRSEGKKEEESKIWYWQHHGISIGSSASTGIANLVLKVGEMRMLKRLSQKEGEILYYKRYIDDIICLIQVPTGTVEQWKKDIEQELNNLDTEGGCVKVEGKGIEISRRARAGEDKGMSKELEFLDVLVQIGRTPGGFPFLETGVYRKESAADMYISSTSYHPQSLKVGMMRGEKIRYLTLCSTKARFEAAWSRFRTALETRGYSKSFVEGAGADITWEEREKIHKKMDLKRESRKKGEKEKMRGTPVIVPHKPGVDEWWQKCTRQGTVDLEGLEGGEKGFLPDRLLKCMKGTSKLSQMLGKKNKRQEEGEEK